MDATHASEKSAGYFPTKLNGVMFQKTVTLIFTAVTNPDTSTNTGLSNPPPNFVLSAHFSLVCLRCVTQIKTYELL